MSESLQQDRQQISDKIAHTTQEIDSFYKQGPKCLSCGKYSYLTSGEEVYGEGWNHIKVFVCEGFPRCESWVSADKNGNAIGLPAGPFTRLARKETRELFDTLWKDGHMKRVHAYDLMEDTIGQRKISMLTEKQCKLLMDRIKDWISIHTTPEDYYNSEYWNDEHDF